jgi:hypothetical protein
MEERNYKERWDGKEWKFGRKRERKKQKTKAGAGR